MELLGTFYHVSQTILVNSKTEHKNLRPDFNLFKDHFNDFGTDLVSW